MNVNPEIQGWNRLLPELKQIIQAKVGELAQKPNSTREEVQSFGRMFTKLALVNKQFKNAFNPVLRNLASINELMNKYWKYQKEFSYPEESFSTWALEKGLGGNPVLLDALLTGYNQRRAPCSVDAYSIAVEEDIKKIVRLNPSSLASNMGFLYARHGVTPLIAACFNQNVPLSVIEFLLQQGADANVKYSGPHGRGTFLEDTQSGLLPERINGIRELFLKYGYKQESETDR